MQEPANSYPRTLLDFAQRACHFALRTLHSNDLRGGGKPGSVHPPLSRWAELRQIGRSFLWDATLTAPQADSSGAGEPPLTLHLPCTGRVCPPGSVAAPDVRSYRTVSPLPEDLAEISALLRLAYANQGSPRVWRFFSVARSISRSRGIPGVTRRPALRCPDFPQSAKACAVVSSRDGRNRTAKTCRGSAKPPTATAFPPAGI